MTVHINRDYLVRTTNTINQKYVCPYITAMFLRRVLGYSHVGNTGYNINTIGTYLIATGDTTPSSAPTFPGGNKAGINYGAGAFFEVGIPVGVRTVSAGDIGRILVLKSVRYPYHNSGCFYISGVNTTNNRYIVDYRANSENPPAEPDDSIMWWLYAGDNAGPTQGSDATSGGYVSNGNSTTPRIILQSPHATGWQIRICHETTTSVLANCNIFTMTPGFGGDANGDFPIGGRHLHTPLFYDTSSSSYRCGNGGGWHSTSSQIITRIYTFGNDEGTFLASFYTNKVAASFNNCIILGIPDNEPVPVPIDNLNRLYVLGNTSGHFGANTDFQGGINLSVVPGNSNVLSQGIQGQAAALYSKFPISCSPSLWTYITGNNQSSSISYSANAGDSPFIQATELLPIDLVAGLFSIWNTSIGNIYPIEPRVMGTIPYIRQGRSLSTTPNFTITNDNSSTFNITAATNASPIAITTSASHGFSTGDTVVISGNTINTAANGTWVITVTGTTTFTLNGSTGNGTNGGGTVVRPASHIHANRGIYVEWHGPSTVP